jgi:hypothetical protein
MHILLHEVGHALGIEDECGAEEFAHQWSNPEIWAYDECQPTAPTAPVVEAPTLEAPQVVAAPQAPVYTPATPTVSPTVNPVAPAQPTVSEPAPPAPTVPSIPPYTDSTPPAVNPCYHNEVLLPNGVCYDPSLVPSTPVVCKGNCPNDPIIPPVHAEPNPTPATPEYCTNPQLGDAHAGIGLTCQLDSATPIK